MKNSVRAITALSIDSATLTGGLDPFSATGLPHACSIVRVVNASGDGVGVSIDGVTVHDFVPANFSLELNFQANSHPSNKVANLAKGSNVCIAGAANVGTIYLVGYYQE